MCTEIEAKLKVDSVGPVVERLRSAGAEFVCRQFQCDVYFDDAAGGLVRGDKGLRLRRTDSEFVLAFKGAREASAFKRRREIETGISDGPALEKILAEIGYRRTIEVEKERELWRLGGCDVCLDEVRGLGSFVEIEGASEAAVEEVAGMLGLEGEEHIAEGYAVLMSQKRGGN